MLLIKYFILKLVILDIITLFSISLQFDSISSIEIEYRLESNQIDFKIIKIDSSFESISRIKIVESNRFQ